MKDIRTDIHKLIDGCKDEELLFNICIVLMMHGKGMCRFGDCCRGKYLN